MKSNALPTSKHFPLDRRRELVSRICATIANTPLSLTKVLKSDDDYPSRNTFYEWLLECPDLGDNYARAREMQADFIAEEVVEIADTETDAAKARNRIDARKWAAGIMKPKVYGNRIHVEGDMTLKTMSDEQLDARLAQLLQKAGGAP